MKQISFIIISWFLGVSVVLLSSCGESKTVETPTVGDVPVQELGEQGHEIDYAKARGNLLRACNLDNFAACQAVGDLTPLPPDTLEIDLKALSLREGFYVKACDGGYMRGCNSLSAHWKRMNDLGLVLSSHNENCEGGDLSVCSMSAAKTSCDKGNVEGCFMHYYAMLDQAESDRDPAIFKSLQIKVCQIDSQEFCYNIGIELQGSGNEEGAAKRIFELSCISGFEQSCYRAIDLQKSKLKMSDLVVYRAKICELSHGTVCTRE